MAVNSLTTFGFGAENLYQSSLPLNGTSSNSRNSYFDQKSINLGTLGGQITQGNFTYSTNGTQSDSTPIFTSLFPSTSQEDFSNSSQVPEPSVGPYIWRYSAS